MLKNIRNNNMRSILAIFTFFVGAFLFTIALCSGTSEAKFTSTTSASGTMIEAGTLQVTATDLNGLALSPIDFTDLNPTVTYQSEKYYIKLTNTGNLPCKVRISVINPTGDLALQNKFLARGFVETQDSNASTAFGYISNSPKLFEYSYLEPGQETILYLKFYLSPTTNTTFNAGFDLSIKAIQADNIPQYTAEAAAPMIMAMLFDESSAIEENPEILPEEVVTEEPIIEEEVVPEIVTEEQTTEEVAVQEVVTEELATEEVVVPEVVTEESSTEEVAVPEVLTEESATEEVVVPEVVTEEPSTEEVIVPEVVTEEPSTEEVVVPEVITEEPATEEVIVPEVITEEPSAEEEVLEVIIEETVTEENATDETIITTDTTITDSTENVLTDETLLDPNDIQLLNETNTETADSPDTGGDA